MLCALTLRRLKPGTFVQFRETFVSGEPTEEVGTDGLYEIVEDMASTPTASPRA